MGAPWLGGRGPQLLIFRLGEQEVLGSSGTLGLAVRLRGWEGSWGNTQRSECERPHRDPTEGTEGTGIPQTDKAGAATPGREGAPASGWDNTCRGWWGAMAPGLFTAGAGGLWSSCRGYSTMEKAARGKVLDEHRTADTLLDEVPTAQGTEAHSRPRLLPTTALPTSQGCCGPPPPCSPISTVTPSRR